MGDSNKKVSYEITAEAAGFTKTVEDVAGKLTGMTEQVNSQFGRVGKMFEELQSKLLVITGIIAGGKFFKEAIAEANKLTGETMNLSKRLGLTAEEASALNTALGDIGSDSDTYIGAFDKFAKQLRTNEQGLRDMGIQTRDANGHLRDANDVYREAISVVGEYKPGLDQTTAAQTLFGKGVEDVMKLQKLNNKIIEEAREKNEALGLTVTKEGVEGSKRYKAAMNDVGDVLLAVKNAIGQAVMPVFSELGEYFAQSGPYVVNVFKGALTGLMAVFRALKMVVKDVMAVIFETISQTIDQFGNLAELISAVLHGDFDAAAAAGKRMAERWGQGFKNVKTEIADNLEEAQQSFSGDTDRIWGKGTALGAPKGGTGQMGEFKDKARGNMPGWEAQLAEAKLAYQEQQNAAGSFRQFDKAQEAQFWRDRLAITVAGSNDNLAVRRKLAELQLAINKDAFEAEVGKLKAQEAAYKNNTDAKLAILDREAELMKQRFGVESKEYADVQKAIVETKRQAAEQVRQIAETQANAERQAALSVIELQRQAAQLELDLGATTRAEYLQQEQQFEERRYAISRDAVEQRLQLAEKDPDRNPAELAKIHAELELLEEQHQQRIEQIKSQQKMDSLGPLVNTMKAGENAFANAIQGMINKTMTLRQAMASIWKSISQTIIGEISKIIARKIAAFATERALAIAGIGADAAKAGSGAASAVANIPYVGPILALAAFAAVFGSVSAASSKVPSASAAGGYDIPAAVNPVVQTHAREMILPAKYADVIRQMADAGAGAGGDMTVHYHDTSGTLSDAEINNKAAKIADALNRVHRNGWRPRS